MRQLLPRLKPFLAKNIRLGIQLARKQISLSTAALVMALTVLLLTGANLYSNNRDLRQQLAGLEDESGIDELCTLKMSNEWLKNRVAILQEERAALLDTAVAELDAKSRLVESILDSVGVDITVQLSRENSGGQFIRSAGAPGDELILRTEQYLNIMQNIPLGAPVPGVLTSKFGWRDDPINGEHAYHRGVDIRGERGADVKATADGKVKVETYAKGDGRYIMIDHGNGFVTKYAHLKKSLVQKGDTVVRGQVIGLVGSTGRSTGPHVHYEIHYNDKIVNPTRFVRIAGSLEKFQDNK